jgi:septum formation protein
MGTPVTQIVLASASDRRKILLEQMGVVFDVVVVDVDETPHIQETPLLYVQRLAELKARTVLQKIKNNLPVLGADTSVVFENHILGKPRDAQHAVEMLMLLSGKKHHVMTSVAMINQERLLSFVSTTEVSFDEITPAQAQAYWQTSEPADKAGAYAIQGLAAMWIKEIKGSYSGVMGLPLYETAQLLKAFDVSIWRH